MTEQVPSSRRRLLLALAAVAALSVCLLFVFIGDGAPAPSGAGPVRRYGHAVVWGLLAACFTTLAIGRGPRWLPNLLGGAALALYLGFLATVLLGVRL